MSLGPPWAIELLANWSRAEWRDAEHELGLPSVSPTFRGLLEISVDIDVSGYSAAEVQAVAAAVEQLHKTKPNHYRALSRFFRPWVRGVGEASDDDERLVRESIQMVADFVDKTLG